MIVITFNANSCQSKNPVVSGKDQFLGNSLLELKMPGHFFVEYTI
jgi:hypothetical protein